MMVSQKIVEKGAKELYKRSKKKEHVKSKTFLMESTWSKQSISVDTFITVSYVEEIVFFMMFLIQSSHCSTSWGDNIVDKEKEGILWSQVNSLADQEVELANSQVWWDQVFLLIQITNSSFWCLFDNNLKWFGQRISKLIPIFCSRRALRLQLRLFSLLVTTSIGFNWKTGVWSKLKIGKQHSKHTEIKFNACSN